MTEQECRGYVVVQHGEWQNSQTFIPAVNIFVTQGEITIADENGRTKAVYAPGKWASVHRIDSLVELEKLSPKLAKECQLSPESPPCP